MHPNLELSPLPKSHLLSTQLQRNSEKSLRPQDQPNDQQLKKSIAALGDKYNSLTAGHNLVNAVDTIKKEITTLINDIKSAPDATKSASIFGDGTTNAEENLFLLESALSDSQIVQKNNFPAAEYKQLIADIQQARSELSKQSSYFTCTAEKEEAVIKQSRITTWSKPSLYSHIPAAIKKPLETIKNNGNAGDGYANSCGAIAVFDALAQKNSPLIKDNTRESFAREFKDETYTKAQKVITCCAEFEKVDKILEQNQQYKAIQYKGLNDALHETGLGIDQKPLSPEQIKILANKTIEYTDQSNKIASDHSHKVLQSFKQLLEDIYANYSIDYVKSCLIAKSNTLIKYIQEKQNTIMQLREAATTPEKIAEYNKVQINLYSAQDSLTSIEKLLTKVQEHGLTQLSNEELFSIYKCTDHCFSPAAIYDIELEIEPNKIAKKKELFDKHYKNQQLSNAQIGIGLAKYGYVLHSIATDEQNNRAIKVTYCHVKNPANTIKLVNFPGDWEALQISG